jgi:hypothetical protein
MASVKDYSAWNDLSHLESLKHRMELQADPAGKFMKIVFGNGLDSCPSRNKKKIAL